MQRQSLASPTVCLELSVAAEELGVVATVNPFAAGRGSLAPQAQ